jgi:hypothetical protein
MSKIGIQTRGSGAVMRKYLRGGGLAKRGTGVALKTGGRAAKFGGGRTNLLEELGRVEAERSNPNRRAEISRVHGELNRGYKDGGRIGFKKGGDVYKPSAADKKYSKYLEKKYPIKKLIKTPVLKRSGKADGGRVGLKHGGKPWGAGPKPGTLEHFQHATQTPKRKRKAIGGALKLGKHLVKKFKKKKVYPETEDLTHQVGPYVGDVGSEGKIRKAGPSAPKRKSPGGRPKDPPGRESPRSQGPRRDKGRRYWRDLMPGRREPFKKGGSDKNWIQKATASIKKRGTKGKCTPITKPGCTGRAKALAKTFKKMAAKRKT